MTSFLLKTLNLLALAAKAMIRIAKILEIAEIMALAKACALDMQARGIHQWNDSYPGREIFENDILRGKLFVYISSGKVVGTVAISSHQDEVYKHVNWLDTKGAHRYIHRLAVLPSQQRQGIATNLMDFAEERCRQQGIVSIRLDTFSRNQGNQLFYEKRGYAKLDDIFLPRQSSFPFHCYELVLESKDVN